MEMPIPSPSNKAPNEKTPAPALHTMQTDAQEMLKKTPSSLIQTLAKQSDTAPTHRIANAHRPHSFLLPLGLGIIFLFAAGLTVLFFRPFLVSLFSPPPPIAQTKNPPSAPSFFSVEKSQEIIFGANDSPTFFDTIRRILSEKYPARSITELKITLQDGPEKRIMSLVDFFHIARMEPPRDLAQISDSPPMLFFTAGALESHFGFAVKVEDEDRALAAMIAWEQFLSFAFKPFFPANTEFPGVSFENRTFRNIDWRYFSISQEEDKGIGYVIFPAHNLLVITTSAQGMEDIIARLFSQR